MMGMFDRDEFEDIVSAPPIAEGYWRTRAGVDIYIRDMETSHLVNTMAYLWRVGTLEQIANEGKIPSFYQKKIWELSKELKLRLQIVKLRASTT